MNKDQELENYLSISKNKFGIYLFDVKNLKNLYKEELIINKNVNFIDLNELKKFLDNNIFKIEKLSGKFVENIYLIFEDEKNLDIEVGIKKKNYNRNLVNGQKLSLGYIKNIHESLMIMDSGERLKLNGMEKGREIVIIYGLFILLSILWVLKKRVLYVSDSGVLEGLVQESN